MKIGDLVMVGMTGDEEPVTGIVTEICLPKDHQNNMSLIQVLKLNGLRWFPAECAEVINESQRSC